MAFLFKLISYVNMQIYFIVSFIYILSYCHTWKDVTFSDPILTFWIQPELKLWGKQQQSIKYKIPHQNTKLDRDELIISAVVR